MTATVGSFAPSRGRGAAGRAGARAIFALGCGRIGYESRATGGDAAAAPGADAETATDHPFAADAAGDARSAAWDASQSDPAPPPRDGAGGAEDAAAAPDRESGGAGDAGRGCRSNHPSLILCADFEDGLVAPPGAYTYFASPRGSVALESDVVSRGARSAALVAGEPEGGGKRGRARTAFFSGLLPSPVTSGRLHLRVYLYVPSGFAITSWLVNLELWDNNSTAAQTVLFPQDRVAFNVETATFMHDLGNGALPRDRWFCAEIGLTVAGGAVGSGEYRQDGMVRAAFGSGGTLPPGGWRGWNVGIIADDRTLGAKVFVDDIVIATQPVGCN